MDKLRGQAAAALLRILSWFPFPVLAWLGNLQGYCSYWMKSRSRLIIEANLKHCFPDWTPQQRAEFTRRNLQETAKTAVEMGAIWHWPCDKTHALIREVHGQRLLDSALAKKRGVILLTPHLGNWEVVGFFAAQIARVTSLYAPATLEALDRLMYAGRTRNGSTLVPTNAMGVKALLKALKAGEITILLPDQVPEEGSGVFAPFFGQPALTMTLLASLAKRTGAEVLCCYAKRRDDRQGFDIYLQATGGIDAQDELMAVTAMNQFIERCINACPEQYQWGYKRFRERKEGAPSVYTADRRLQFRRYLRERVPAMYASGTDNGSGSVLNLAAGGVMLATGRPLMVGVTYTINLSCPGPAGNFITAEAKCVWSRANNDRPGEYRSGLLITFMPKDDGLRLLQLLEDYENRQWHTVWRLACYQAIARLPLAIPLMVSRLIGMMHHRLKTRLYKNARANIRFAFPEWGEVQQRQLILSTLRDSNRVPLTRPFMRLASSRQLERECPVTCGADSLAIITTALAKQRGVILVLPNLGCVEMVLRDVARRAPLTLFHQRVSLEIQERILCRMAIRDGYALSDTHEGYMASALKILNQGGVVAVLPQPLIPFPPPVQAPWFGHSVSITNLYPLVTGTEADILCAYGRPDVDGRGCEIRFMDIHDMKTAADAAACAVSLSHAIEQCVRDAPWLYGWVHRVFPKKLLSQK